MAGFLHDFRYAFRTLRQNPSFTVTAVAAMALGIGANAAIFSIVSGVLLHPLPYEKDSDLVMLWEDATPRGGTNRVPAAPGNFLDWKAANPSFTDIAALRNESLRLTSLEEPLVPLLHLVTANYFDLLGVEPLLGRTFVSGEDRPGMDRVVLISYGLWQKVLGGDPSILGQPLVLDHEPYTVIGILRPDFYSVHLFGVQPDLWAPLVLDGAENDRIDRGLMVYGRLREGDSLFAAQAAMSTVAQATARDHPETNAGWTVRVVPIRQEVVGNLRTILLALLGAVGFVLLVACANVANLTLAKATERTREIALRRALGAGSWRLARQLVTESVVLAALGGLTGLLLAAWALQPLVGLVPNDVPVPFVEDASLDGTVLTFTLTLSILTGLLFGLAPARHASRRDLNDPLKHGRSPSPSPGSRRFGNALVVAEVALALVLMAGAGLMIQSFRNLRGYPTGFDSEKILTLRNSIRGPEFQEPQQRIAHFQELTDRLAALPGVASASAVSFPPPSVPFQAATFSIPGEPAEPGHEPSGTLRVVLPGYFETMGIARLKGRPITAEDREDSAPVAVVSQTLVRRYFPERDPIGQFLIIESSAQPELSSSRIARQIVGVVGDVRAAAPNPDPLPIVYLPHRQAPLPIMNLVARTEGNPEELLRAAERTAWSMGGDVNVYGVETLDQRIARLDFGSKVSTVLLAWFAALAMVLGAAGIYAVISYTVSRQTHELGLRMALGASRGSVLKMVLGSGLRLTAMGIGIGMGLSLALARLIESLLYGVSSGDLVTLGSVALLMIAVAAAACLVPAYRASRVDPMISLRYE